jgi:methionyl-tRNA formyltransferase
VVVAYSQIIPKEILDAPKYGCINLHGSLLPRCRGAACIQKPIMDGDGESGVTVMLMDEGLDTGPILSQKEIKIENNDTTGTMFEKVSQAGAELLIPTLRDYIDGKIKPQPQVGTADYVGQIKKKNGHIDFTKSAVEIERFIRAMTPWPGAFAFANVNGQEKMIKIISVEHQAIDRQGQAGELACHDNNLLLQCQDQALKILEIQLEGKKKISADEFICGSKENIVLK